MDWIAAIIVGALIGWIASMIMKTDAEQGALANIIVGIVGSAVGKWVFADVLGIGGVASAGSFTFYGLAFGVAGAVLLIAILKAFRVLA